MAHSKELLEAVRRILNEVRQDKTCRAFLAKKGDSAHLLPFVGAAAPVYMFLGQNPAGVDIEDPPTTADDYLEFAQRYFASPDTDKASFAAYLPYAANQSGDYDLFGQVACATSLVPIRTKRSSEVSLPLIKSCWPRVRALIGAMRPKLILCHGAIVWRFLVGLEDGTTPVLLDLPDELRLGPQELYEKVAAERLPCQTRLEGLESEYRPWLVTLPHLGGAGGGRDARKKAEQAVALARRYMHDGGTAPKAPGGAIRVRVRKAT